MPMFKNLCSRLFHVVVFQGFLSKSMVFHGVEHVLLRADNTFENQD